MADQTILVTGGAGFIGTHTALLLLNQGYKVTLFDNLYNSAPEAVERVKELAGAELAKKLEFHVGDLRNKEDLEVVFSKQNYGAVIHFGALKAVA